MSNPSDNNGAAVSSYFLYRDPSNFYRASDRITMQHCQCVPVQDGDAFLTSLGLNLCDVGFGYVAMPKVDLAQTAYDRLLKLDDVEDKYDRADEEAAINMTIAMCLGYRVQMPTNYPYTTITTDRFASPYESDNRFAPKFKELPDYVDNLVAARSVASREWDLSIKLAGGAWNAVYTHRTTKAAFGHKGKIARTVILLSALATLIKP